jgi:hypothetical protein
MARDELGITLAGSVQPAGCLQSLYVDRHAGVRFFGAHRQWLVS